MSSQKAKHSSDWGIWLLLLGFPVAVFVAIAAASLPFYVLLGDRGSGIALPLALGGPTLAGVFQLYRAVAWWRGQPLPDEGNRSILDKWNFVDDSDDLRKGAVAEAIAEVTVVFSVVAYFFWMGTATARPAAIIGGVASAIAGLVWLAVVLSGRPHGLLPASYRRAARAAKGAV